MNQQHESYLKNEKNQKNRNYLNNKKEISDLIKSTVFRGKFRSFFTSNPFSCFFKETAEQYTMQNVFPKYQNTVLWLLLLFIYIVISSYPAIPDWYHSDHQRENYKISYQFKLRNCKSNPSSDYLV